MVNVDGAPGHAQHGPGGRAHALGLDGNAGGEPSKRCPPKLRASARLRLPSLQKPQPLLPPPAVSSFNFTYSGWCEMVSMAFPVPDSIVFLV